MKKNLWFVFVALAMVAIFTVAGCRPMTPSTPTPTPTATPAPTVAPDKACPKVVSTVASKIYEAGRPGAFKIVITFDEPITSACIENPANWEVYVKNSGRIGSDFKSTNGRKVSVSSISISNDYKKVTLKAAVEESFTYTVIYSVYNNATGQFTDYGLQITKTFDGLICSEGDAKTYVEPADTKAEDAAVAGPPYNLPYDPRNYVKSRSLPSAPTAADVVIWKLKNCVVCDDLNNCCCDYSGSDCCLEPVCEECVEGCPLGGGICQ